MLFADADLAYQSALPAFCDALSLNSVLLMTLVPRPELIVPDTPKLWNKKQLELE